MLRGRPIPDHPHPPQMPLEMREACSLGVLLMRRGVQVSTRMIPFRVDQSSFPENDVDTNHVKVYTLPSDKGDDVWRLDSMSRFLS
jgi:hypothetical protein